MTDFTLGSDSGVLFLTLTSDDGLNRLTRQLIENLSEELENIAEATRRGAESTGYSGPIVFSGFENFSAGADLNEIAMLTGTDAYAFSRAGQRLMNLIDDFPALTIAAVSGYCMGGGLDLALACDVRIAGPNAIFGHRGASLGLITGWGGTQRLPRVVGKGRALQMFCAAEKLHAREALAIGLVNSVAEDPVAAALAMANGK